MTAHALASRRLRRTLCIAALAHLVAAVSVAHADEVADACYHVSRSVGPFKNALVREVPDVFEDEGKVYRGCVVTIVGDRDKLPGKLPPADRAYPRPGSAAARAGWKADREADGADGTSYRIRRGNVFCLVSGSWDGGDASDPRAVPSSLFVITGQCAKTR